jgi:DNA-binding response OmpR family regulator
VTRCCRQGVEREQLVPLVEIGTVNAHHIQALPQRSCFIIDGEFAIVCTPLEYQVALHLLREPQTPLSAAQLSGSLVGSERQLRNAVTRLRRKLASLGLSIQRVITYGYALTRSE